MPQTNSLNAEESLIARTQCTKISKPSSNARFWGKVFGSDSDYYILTLSNNLDLESEQFYYTLSMIEEGQDAAPLIAAEKQPAGFSNMYRFTGSPDTVLIDEQEATTEDEGKFSEGAPAYLESHHLAYIVNSIIADTNFSPRGYYTRNIVSGELRRGNYTGLSSSEALQLSSYWFPSAGPPTGGVKTLEDVKPRASWSTVRASNDNWVYVRSLIWLGFELHLEIGTPNFSSHYFGNGQRNNDLAFMV